MKTVFLCAAVTFDDVPSGRRTCSPNLPPSTVARWQRNPRWTNASDVKRQGFRETKRLNDIQKTWAAYRRRTVPGRPRFRKGVRFSRSFVQRVWQRWRYDRPELAAHRRVVVTWALGLDQTVTVSSRGATAARTTSCSTGRTSSSRP